MSDKPFDQEQFEPKRPQQTEAQRAFAQTAELQRIASLNFHVRRTIDAARAALDAGDPDQALEIIQDASLRYTRFGGPGPKRDWKPKTGEEN